MAKIFNHFYKIILKLLFSSFSENIVYKKIVEHFRRLWNHVVRRRIVGLVTDAPPLHIAN